MRGVRPGMLHALLWIFGVLAIVAEWAFRIPGPAAFVFLPWVGIGLTSLSILSVLARIVREAPADDAFRRAVLMLQRVDTVLMLAFIGHAFVLFVNASWSSSLHVSRHSDVLARGGGGSDSRLVAWAELRPWQEGQSAQRVLLYPSERDLWGGQPVLVNFREGFFNQPWVLSIEPDDERRLRAALKVMPTAAQVWTRLVDFLFRHSRHDEAVAVANEYLKIYPNDYDFAMSVAAALFNINLHPRSVPIMEPFLAKRPTLELHQMLGFALFRAERRVEGEALMRKAIEMEPDEWLSYYYLGYAYFYAGDPAGALPWFERLLQIAPNFPEIQDRVRTIRAAGRPASPR